MTLIAGVLARGIAPVDEALAHELVSSLSRARDDRPWLHRSSAGVLAAINIGAYGSSGIEFESSGRFTLVSGDPLLEESESPRGSGASRARVLHRAFVEENRTCIRRAHGVFAAAHFDPASGRLVLVSDKLGVRPLFYWWDDAHFVFASALRVLEAVSRLPKRMDLRALTEIASIGIPLGRRTPYAGIERISAAELMCVHKDEIARETYWRWDEIAERPLPEREMAERLDRGFRRAVRRRLTSEQQPIAFLSGGMDSRAIAATLVEEQAPPITFNFSIEGMQDHLCAAQFANRIGVRHLRLPSMPLVVEEPRFSYLMKIGLVHLETNEGNRNGSPRVVWSGDGGSVGVGHVYLTEPVVEALRAGRAEQAVNRFIDERGARFPKRVFRKEFMELLGAIPLEGILKELADLTAPDPGRAFHLFLLLNDQRRHLAMHFENIDLHRVEFHLPFFDWEVLQAVLASPLDACLLHRLYTRWFEILHPAVTAVPWQTYPGHVPCPLPSPAGGGYQWDPSSFRTLRNQRRRHLLSTAASMLGERDFPSEILSRGRLAVATLAYGMRLRDCGHLLRTAEIFSRYWKVCRGNYAV